MEVGSSIDGGRSLNRWGSELNEWRIGGPILEIKAKGPLQARGGGLCGCGQFGFLLSDEALGRIVRLLAHGGLANGLFVTLPTIQPIVRDGNFPESYFRTNTALKP